MNKNVNMMNLILSATVVMLVICFSCVTGPSQKEPRIAGIVTDQDSVGLAGVWITVTTFDKEAVFLTGNDGRFLLDSLETGMYDLEFSLPGYTSATIMDIELSEDKPGAKYWVVLKYSPVTLPKISNNSGE